MNTKEYDDAATESVRCTEFTGQWAILPARVRYDRSLPANAKLIYAEIAAKINEEGFCFCHNAYFSERLGVKRDTVGTLVKRLEDAGYIRVDIDVARGNTDRRRIYLTAKPYEWGVPDLNRVPQKKKGTPKKPDTVPDLNRGPIENRDIQDNPPKAPQWGRARREPKKEPDWKPERFAAFWSSYPRGESKQAAIAAWDKLRPSDELLVIMAKALKRQMQTEQWQRGIGIPYASTWLNQRRWEDEGGKPVPPWPVGPAGGELPVWT